MSAVDTVKECEEAESEPLSLIEESLRYQKSSDALYSLEQALSKWRETYEDELTEEADLTVRAVAIVVGKTATKEEAESEKFLREREETEKEIEASILGKLRGRWSLRSFFGL